MADGVGLGVGAGVGEAVEVKALDTQGVTDSLNVLRDVRAAVEIRPLAELLAATADRVVGSPPPCCRGSQSIACDRPVPR
jgi:hypothetical protein